MRLWCTLLALASGLVLALGSFPGPADADELLAIEAFAVCRFYVPERGDDPGKIYLSFAYPNQLPRDVRSITVRGPGGFHLALHNTPLTVLNWNGYQRVPMGPGLPADTHYMGFTRQPMPEGLYTVTVAGVAGDTVTASRVFTDTSGAFIPTIDLIDYTRFSPIDHQTAVPRTPTLSWDVVEGDDLYYAVRVWQGRRLVFADNVFKNKTGLNKGSLTIPRGVLQARTWYTWNVEVCDSDELSEINHCAWLRSVAFRTGD